MDEHHHFTTFIYRVSWNGVEKAYATPRCLAFSHTAGFDHSISILSTIASGFSARPTFNPDSFASDCNFYIVLPAYRLLVGIFHSSSW